MTITTNKENNMMRMTYAISLGRDYFNVINAARMVENAVNKYSDLLSDALRKKILDEVEFSIAGALKAFYEFDVELLRSSTKYLQKLGTILLDTVYAKMPKTS